MILKAYKQMNEFWECLNSNGCKVFATYRNSKSTCDTGEESGGKYR